MKNKLLLLFVVILFVVYLSKGSLKEETSFFNYSLVIKNVSTNQIFEINMEDYLVGVLAGEMPASYDDEALKAQAVASRTFAYFKSLNRKQDYDLTTDNKTQVYLTEDEMKKKWGSNYENNVNKITKAIKDTEGQIITYDNKVISAYYFSMSNGMTENSKDVFNENKPYLVSVSSLETSDLKNYTRAKTYTYKEFCEKLSIYKCDVISVDQIKYSETHHVSKVVINGKEYAGTTFRKLLNLYSTDFKIIVKDKEIVIECNGHGHDVGMSQYGANLMAKQGYNYEQIIKHYYTGVEIQKINV